MAIAPTAIGALRVVGGADTTAALQRAAQERAAANAPPAPDHSGLSGYVLSQYEMMRRHRSNSVSGWADRMLAGERAFNGQYDPSQLADIKQFGGSTAYARMTAMKCRGTSSLLRDVYLGPDAAWALIPDPDPEIPAQILQAIQALASSECTSASNAGQQLDPGAIRDRIAQLTEAARQAAKAKAAKQATIAQDKLNDMLDEGGFYHALAEFLNDLPMFPFACIKGPMVRLKNIVKWTDGEPTATTEPRLVWSRISPFDLFFTPGVSDIANANVIERSRLTRAEINDLLDLPGYITDEVRAVLDEYGHGGIADNWDQTDSERAIHESREDPRFNQSGMIACLEFQGYAQGKLLLEVGMDASLIPDELRDYFVQVWQIGHHVIKVQVAPSPRKRHQYYMTSFEKVPGTPVGNGLPDILKDIQDAANATLRSLINNLSIASGPQVVINMDRVDDGADVENLYPWKRWKTRSDPLGNNTEPAISFFMPTINSSELMAVYGMFTEIGDEMSAVPRYMTGAQAGTVGRTASGLSMLMSNSAKILQTVAANIDGDVIEGILTGLLDMVLLTDTSGLLTGEEVARVLGVKVAVQKETQRARQLEFLQITANPIDAQIVGPKGRATILREVATTLGLPGEQIVPSDEQLTAMQKQAAMVAQQNNQPGHGGMGQQANDARGSQQGSNVTMDQGPRTNIAGGPQ